MAPRLHAHALLRIDQHHGGVGGRSAGGHVARVLLVARAIGDDELAAWRLEIAIGHVDGDALLALGLQAVDQQGEIGDFARRAPAPAVVRDGGKLVVEHLARVVQQAADQRALAVVDAAAGDEAQQVDLALLREELLQRARRFRRIVGGRFYGKGGHLRNNLRACDFPSQRRTRRRWRGSGAPRSWCAASLR